MALLRSPQGVTVSTGSPAETVRLKARGFTEVEPRKPRKAPRKPAEPVAEPVVQMESEGAPAPVESE